MKAEVRMEKSAAMLLLHVTIKGEVTRSATDAWATSDCR